MTLPGVAGPVTFGNDVLRGHRLMVDGRPVRPVRGSYLLPGVDGREVPARLKGRWLSAHPTVVIGSQRYKTGPETPSWLGLAVVLPLLFVLGGGFFPLVLAAAGMAFNLFVLRSPRSEVARFVLMMAGFVAAVLLFFVATLVVGLVQLATR